MPHESPSSGRLATQGDPMLQIQPALRSRRSQVWRIVKKTLKRVVPLALALYFIPWVLAGYVLFGLIDVLRNKPRSLRTFDRYYAGNGVFTWLLSPFNLLLDLFCLPYWNRGIYELADLPKGYRDEIQSLIDAANRRDLVGLLESKLGEKKRGMIFFKWYGKNVPASVEMPEYHSKFKFIRTIGLARAADLDAALLSTETHLALDAYADGVNKLIEQRGDALPIEFVLLGYKPERWTATDSLVIPFRLSPTTLMQRTFDGLPSMSMNGGMSWTIRD